MTNFIGASRRITLISSALLVFALSACSGGGGGGAGTAAAPETSGTTIGAITTGGTGVAATTAQVREDLTNVGIAGRTYFVAMDGNDANVGTLDAPLRTLERALAQVNPGDTIEIRAGTYAPMGNGFPLEHPGTAEARIKIKAHDGEHVTLDAAGKAYAIFLPAEAPYWIIEGLELVGGSFYTVKIDSHHVNLVANDIHGSANDLIKLVQTSDDVVIYGNEIHHNNAPPGANAQGIDIVGGDRTWIAHNFVHDTASIAIYSKGNSRNTIIENNHVENIASRGIMLGQSTDADLLWDGDYETYDGVVRDNIIINTDDACLATASSFNPKILNNSCLNGGRLAHGAIFISNESEKGQAGTNIEIANNIVVTGGRPAVMVGPNALSDPATLSLHHNLYWSTSGLIEFAHEDRGFIGDINAWRATTQYDTTSIVADPRFADPLLALAPDSPTIDAGAATDLVRHDYLHGVRPQGGAIDIGAYEMR